MSILIKNGNVYDGSGKPGIRADVLIDDGLIKAIQPNIASPDSEIIDAAGKIVSPGFIDMHRHADAAFLGLDNFGKTELAQGITTTVTGNCGLAPVPAPRDPAWREELYRYLSPMIGAVNEDFYSYGDFAAAMARRKFPINIGYLAATGAIKVAVRGFAKGPYTGPELEKARSFVEEAMQCGARGISIGLMYQPESHTGKKELELLSSTAAKHGGMLFTHIRGEGNSLVSSVEEVIEIARNAGIALNISHFKSTGLQNWHSAIFRAIEKIEAARAKGQNVCADFYPYDGGSTTILSLIPPHLLGDGITGIAGKFSKKEDVHLLRREISRKHDFWDNMSLSIGWDRVIISSVFLKKNESYCGKSISQAAWEYGYSDEVEFLADLITEEEGRTSIILLSMSYKDIDTVATLPWTCLISDSLYITGGRPHPRLNGAFPKFIRVYVREKKLLSMETAIAKMTRMPAERMCLNPRGLLIEGAPADVLVWDGELFTDNADYAFPSPLASGMDTVIINGKIGGEEGRGIFLR